MVQQYFSESEWAVLVQAPLQAVLAMTLVDKTDPVSFLKEVQVGITAIAAEQQRQDLTNDLVKSVIGFLNELDSKETLQGEELLLKKQASFLLHLQTLATAEEGRTKAIAHFEKVASVLAAKVTAVQASEFRNWLLGIARTVAEAVKEGGFLGVGGERVSDPERSMLKKLEQTLTYQV